MTISKWLESTAFGANYYKKQNKMAGLSSGKRWTERGVSAVAISSVRANATWLEAETTLPFTLRNRTEKIHKQSAFAKSFRSGKTGWPLHPLGHGPALAADRGDRFSDSDHLPRLCQVQALNHSSGDA